MARRARSADAEEEDEMDELERAEASIAKRQNRDKSNKKSSSSSKNKGKERARRQNSTSEEEPDSSDDDNAAGNGNGKGKGGQLSDSDITEKARELARYAICNEVSRRPIRREDINKKILAGATRAFQKVYDEANVMLEDVWGMELVPLYPNDLEDIEPVDNKKSAGKKKKKKNKGRGGDAEDDDEDEDEDVEMEGTAAAKKNNNKKKGPPKMFCLRTTLPDEIIRKAVKSHDSFDAQLIARYDLDLRSALGDAFVGQNNRGDEDLKEWKKGDDAVFDWKTGPDQRTLFGILYTILSLILVNERVLTDEQLQNHLKRLDLRLETQLPLDPSAIKPEKQTLSTFLQALIRQQYLERTKLAGAPAKNRTTNGSSTQGGSTQTQVVRVRATQTSQRSQQQQQAEDSGGLTGDPNSEWRWGPRAFKEFGEDGVASFIKDFYRSHAHSTTMVGNERPSKDGKTLFGEIARGATGGKPDTGLIGARE